MTDYTKLDAAILALVACRPVTFTDILVNRRVREEVKALAAANPRKDEFRFVDGRLQALRKAGKIRHTSAGWKPVAQEGNAQ